MAGEVQEDVVQDVLGRGLVAEQVEGDGEEPVLVFPIDALEAGRISTGQGFQGFGFRIFSEFFPSSHPLHAEKTGVANIYV